MSDVRLTSLTDVTLIFVLLRAKWSIWKSEHTWPKHLGSGLIVLSVAFHPFSTRVRCFVSRQPKMLSDSAYVREDIKFNMSSIQPTKPTDK